MMVLVSQFETFSRFLGCYFGSGLRFWLQYLRFLVLEFLTGFGMFGFVTGFGGLTGLQF